MKRRDQKSTRKVELSLAWLVSNGIEKNTCQVYYYKNRFELSRFFPIKLGRDRNLEGTPPPIDLWRKMVCLGTFYFIDLENIWLTVFCFFGSFPCDPSICFCVNQATTEKKGAPAMASGVGQKLWTQLFLQLLSANCTCHH